MIEEIKKLIEGNALALSTLDKDGRIHTIAVAFCKVVSPNQIIITDNYMGKTAQNLIRDGKVTLAVWNRDWEEDCTGYELRGKSEYLMEGKWLDFAKGLPENKGEPCKAAVLVTIEETKKMG